MAELTFANIFGQNSVISVDPDVETAELVINLNNFRDVANNGQIENDLGISDLTTYPTPYTPSGNKAPNILYALVLLTKQNQAENINADPTQSIFISENPKQFGTGSRDGQIRYSFTVNFFIDSSVGNSPDIDGI